MASRCEPNADQVSAMLERALCKHPNADQVIAMLERALCRARGGAVHLWTAANDRPLQRAPVHNAHRANARASAPFSEILLFRRSLARSAPQNARASNTGGASRSALAVSSRELPLVAVATRIVQSGASVVDVTVFTSGGDPTGQTAACRHS